MSARPTNGRWARRGGFISAVAATLLGVAACAPTSGGTGGGPGGGTVRYVDQVFTATAKTANPVYATADDLVTGQPEDLKLDVYQPVGDALTARPAIVWVHGGGFLNGTKSATTDSAIAYAKRGYVTLSIDYRLDPGNRCQAVQHGQITDPAELATETARCTAAIMAAQHDTQAAIRWLRANASTYGVDPNRIAVAGFSAGAVTAVNVAQRSEDPGTVGSHLDESSSVRVGLAASGCNYLPDSIDADDAPVSLLAAQLDQAVLFSCTVETQQRAQAVGIAVQTLYHFGESTHAKDLYTKYQAETDAAWTEFLVQHLAL